MLKELMRAMVFVVSFLFLPLADGIGTVIYFCVDKFLTAIPDW